MTTKNIILSLITLSLISILFFPQKQIGAIWIPLLIAGILGIIYWKIK
jgi:hypothetical protein